jgi:hypothetical protein
MRTIATLVILLAITACGGQRQKQQNVVESTDKITTMTTDPDHTYFGTWVHDYDNDGGRVLSITADTLVIRDSKGAGCTVAGLTWEAIDEPNGNDDYPHGYKIIGTLCANDGFLMPLPRSGMTAEVGDDVEMVWYISNDRQSLAGGVDSAYETRTYAAGIDKPYIRQPDAVGDDGDNSLFNDTAR